MVRYGPCWARLFGHLHLSRCELACTECIVASCNMQNGALPSTGAPSQPETWPQVCSLGMRQSPIDIPLRNAAAAAAAATGGRPLQPIEIRGYGRVDGRVINTGHGLQVRNTVIITLTSSPREMLLLSHRLKSVLL